MTASIAHADTSAGSTLFVNKAGSCSDTATGAGSQTLPYCSIQAAVDAAKPGDTVQLTGPTGAVYYGPVTVRTSGTASAPITIDGASDYLRTIGSSPVLTVSGAHDVVVRHLQIAPGTAGADVVDVTGSQDLTLDQLTVGSPYGATTPVDAVRIDGSSSTVTVSRSLINWYLSGSAVHVQSGAQHIIVTTNQIYQGLSTSGPAINFEGVTDADATGNSVTSNSAGISVSGAATAVIENNLVRGSNGAAVSVDAQAAPQAKADYNNVYSSGNALYSWAGTSYATVAGFIAATGHGAHDGSTGSPVIDSADSGAPGELSTDRLGHPRADDPNVANTGTGARTYDDRGATETEDFIAHTVPNAPLDVAAGAGVDMEPSSAPTSTWAEALTVTVDFGDGTATQSAPAGTAIPHTFSSPGVYLTTTTITNTDGYAVSYTRDANVLTATAEQPVLKAAPYRAADGSHVAGTEDFTFTGTTPGMWRYSSLQLSYGDATTGAWGSGTDVTHSYSRAGTYPVTLTATDLLGRTSTAATTAVVGDEYLPLPSPKRLYDSRSTGTDTIPAHGTVQLTLGTAGGRDGDAVVLNITATHTRAAGFVTAYPDQTTRPTASVLDFAAGQTVANQTTVREGADGSIDLYNGSSGPIDLVVDQAGAMISDPADTEYHPATPTRLTDTRTLGHQVPGHGSFTVQLPAALQQSPAPDTLELNLTTTNGRGAGYATVYTTGQTLPGASNLNWSTGGTAANLVTVTANAQGQVTVYNGSAQPADFVVDFVGLYRGSITTDPVTGFLPTAPTRLLDTRNGSGPLAPGAQIQVCVPGPAGITAAALNLTVTGSPAAGYLTAYPDGTPRPTTSNVNWSAGQTIANMTQTATGTDGCVELYNGGSQPVSVIADLSGYQITTP
nr:PKD domain-containing protein [Streptomyces sp. 846.5]